MVDIEVTNIKNEFKETIEKIKIYISNLLSRKSENLKKEVKQDVKDILEKKKPESFFDKVKDLFGGKQEESTPQEDSKYESHREDQNEYIPHDMEFGESLGEQSRFAEIYPGFIGYFTSGKKSYFDKNTNLWSKKKKLQPLSPNVDTTKKSYTYAGTLKSGTVSIPLPEGALPDVNSLHYTGQDTPVFQIDQNNCIYITTSEKQYVSFNFHTNQSLAIKSPIPEDSEKIIFDKLSKETRDLIDSFSGKISVGNAEVIRQHIWKTKKYSTRLQGTLRDKSNSKNYITHLDKSEVLECFSANSLFVALCRENGLPARLVVGHMVQSLDKDSKSLLSSNNGHAWSEVWDEKTKSRKRFDATPITKEDGKDSEQNMDKNQNQSGDNKKPDSNMDENQPGGEQGGKQDSEQKQDGQGQPKNGGESQNGAGEQSGGNTAGDSEKTPGEMLDELIQKAKEDNLTAQAEKMKETLEKLEKANSKKEIRDILDKSGLEDFAKKMIDKTGNEEILRQEKEEMKKVEDEKDLYKIVENSLLDDEFEGKLRDYAQGILKQIQNQRKILKSEMERMGFSEKELKLYKLYKELEKGLEGEVKKQIKALEKILPPKFRTVDNDREYFNSGARLGNTGKLIEHHLTGDPKVFRRDFETRESNEINMFETIIIDRSTSMGNFEVSNSPLREAVKASIIRVKVLEYFKVNFSIIIFDTEMEEIMEFGEKFSDRRKNNVPSKFMRAIMKSGGTDVGKPLAYTLESIKKYARKNGLKSFGNVSFLGDGSPTDGIKGKALRSLINQIRTSGFGLTAYYINGSLQNINGLYDYFGSEESGGTVTVSSVSELTDKLIGAYNENLRKIIKKYTKN